jgi:iron complex transport system ATP-binding protein
VKAAAQRSPLLAAHGLALRAGGSPRGRSLFAGLDFEVRAGERWVLLGPNGAGKSSLLGALAAIFPVAEGDVAVDGRSLAQWSPAALAERRAWCPQFWSDPFPATVIDTVQLARHRSGWRAWPAQPDAQTRAVVGRLELDRLEQADVRTLSGGERQRVAIATALLQGAPLLLLDEPASHLDLAHQQLLVRLLVEHAEAGGAVVASLHDLNLAADLASHVVLLDGRGGAIAGPRDSVMTPARLGAAFSLPISSIDVGAATRFFHDAGIARAGGR